MLTKKQARILRYICWCIDRTGAQPSIRDIGIRFGIRSPNGVVCHLKALEKKKFVRRRPQRAGLIINNWKEFVPNKEDKR